MLGPVCPTVLTFGGGGIEVSPLAGVGLSAGGSNHTAPVDLACDGGC